MLTLSAHVMIIPVQGRRLVLLHLFGDVSIPDNWMPIAQIDHIGAMLLVSDPEIEMLLDMLEKPERWVEQGVVVRVVERREH